MDTCYTIVVGMYPQLGGSKSHLGNTIKCPMSLEAAGLGLNESLLFGKMHPKEQ